MFKLNLVDLPAIERIDGGVVRLYKTPEGNLYPSVTSVLGTMGDKSALDEWISRVGIEEADRKTKRSGVRGTNVHLLCEKFILNQEINYKKEMPINVLMFNQLKSELANNVDNIYSSEGMLYSDKLRVAGTMDLAAEWQSKKSIIDFKTSDKNKDLSWIDGYFIQTSLYSYMFWERTGIMCPQLVVMIAMESEYKAQIFIQDVNDWIDKAFDICRLYHEKV